MGVLTPLPIEWSIDHFFLGGGGGGEICIQCIQVIPQNLVLQNDCEYGGTKISPQHFTQSCGVQLTLLCIMHQNYDGLRDH